jgi:ribosomal protein S18 acetylase RimI-like enzyme
MPSDDELYRRGARTALASWEALAVGSSGAAVRRLPGAAAVVFPNGPESAVYNNAIVERGLARAERELAVDAVEAAYAEAGVTRFAVWAHEADRPLRAALERRGYVLDEVTRAMGVELDGLDLSRPDVDLAPADWREHLRLLGVPDDFLAGADPAGFHVLVARLDGDSVATALAFDHDGDCGLYNVATLEHARRRGLGTALTVLQLHAARERGSATATLQASPMAERLYAAAGFRDLGRILEYVPGRPWTASREISGPPWVSQLRPARNGTQPRDAVGDWTTSSARRCAAAVATQRSATTRTTTLPVFCPLST